MHSCKYAGLLVTMLVLITAARTARSESAPHTGSGGTIIFEHLSQPGSLVVGDIYSVEADGSHLMALTHDGNSHNPAWSADGKHILFIHSSLTEHPQFAWEKKNPRPNELYVMNRDGTDAHLLKRLESTIFSAAWSPDGKTVAVTYLPWGWVKEATAPRHGQPVSPGLFLIDADGKGEPRLLLRDAYTPSWSPDGKRLGFSQRLPDSRWEMHVANRDGSHDVQLTDPARRAGGPAWSPSGKEIAFDARVHYDEQVFIMNENGSHERQLTSDPKWSCQQPSWSPDGKQIVAWCMSAWPACGPSGVYSNGRPLPPCLRRIFLISVTDHKGNLRQITEENGVHPQFAPK